MNPTRCPIGASKHPIKENPMPLDKSDVDEIKHVIDDAQPKTIKERLNGSFKPLMIGGGITVTALLTWVFSAGGRDAELTALKVRVDKIEPQVMTLVIKTTVMLKLDEISRQICELKAEIKEKK
jgi:hypothetical protein